MVLGKVISIALTFAAGAIVAGVIFFAKRSNPDYRSINYPENGGGGIGRQERFCGICLKEMEPCEVKKLSCGHTFCSGCMGLLLDGTQRTCPECLREF